MAGMMRFAQHYHLHRNFVVIGGCGGEPIKRLKEINPKVEFTG